MHCCCHTSSLVGLGAGGAVFPPGGLPLGDLVGRFLDDGLANPGYDQWPQWLMVAAEEFLSSGLIEQLGVDQALAAWEAWRNSVCFDGLANAYDSNRVVAETDVIKIVFRVESIAASALNMIFGANGGLDDRFYLAVNKSNGRLSFGYKSSGGASLGSVVPLQTDLTVYIAGDGRVIYLSAKDIDKSAITGSLPSKSSYLGAHRNPSDIASSFSNITLLEHKIWTDVTMANYPDTGGDPSDGTLWTNEPCTRAGVSTVTSEILDVSGNDNHATALPGGGDLTCLVKSAHNVSLAAGLNDSASLAANPLADDAPFTLGLELSVATGETREQDALVLLGTGDDDTDLWSGWVTDGTDYWLQFTDGVNKQEITARRPLPTTPTRLSGSFDGTDGIAYENGVDITAGGVAVTLANVVWPGAFLGAMPEQADSNTTITRVEVDPFAWSAEHAADWGGA